MTKARTIWQQPLRLGCSLLVLANAAAMVGACDSGVVSEPAVGASKTAGEDGAVALLVQGLTWEGGCACVPVTQCPTALNSCISVCAEIGKNCGSGSWCKVAADETSCGLGTRTTCDGGVCGTCTGCKSADGICWPGTFTNACGANGDRCVSCDDRNECTKDSCNSGACGYIPVDDRTPCSNGSCLAAACCTGCVQNGTCQPGSDIAACGSAGGACRACEAPSNRCMVATCSAAGECGTAPAPKGNSCSDGDVCNGEETCDGSGNCLKGTPKDCSTSDPCKIGTCETEKGCVVKPNAGAKCSDGNACTLTDLCDANGKCIGSNARNCDDTNFCTTDSCDPKTGTCLNSPANEGQSCDDGVSCTNGETCQGGTCKAGNLDCDDKNLCTQDVIECPAAKCGAHVPTNVGKTCSPLDLCVTNGRCDESGNCKGDTQVNCDDGNPCTKDGCDSTTGCFHNVEPLTTPCVDGNPCTSGDHCRLGKCTGDPIVCAPLDECHLAPTCDEKTGRCGDDPRRPDGDPCANGAGSCSGGVCRVTGAAGAAGASGLAGTAGWDGQAGAADTAGAAGTAGSYSVAGAGTAGRRHSVGAAGAALAAGAAGAAGSAGAGAVLGGSPAGGALATTVVAPANGGAPNTPPPASGGAVVTTIAPPPEALGGATVVVTTSPAINPADIYQRDPGGCSCRLPNHAADGSLSLLGLLALALGAAARQRMGKARR